MARKSVFLAVFFLALAGWMSAQSFDCGNSWYRPAQEYIKLLVAEDGLYRVNYADLAAAGFDSTGKHHSRYHLIYRGKEVPMWFDLSGPAWNGFMFFGKRNDGDVDSLMYRDPYNGSKHSADAHPNQRISLFTDTSAYFLTWNDTVGIRFNENSDPGTGLSPEPHFRYEAIAEYHPDLWWVTWNIGGGSRYNPYQDLNCEFIPGEGYLGPGFSYGAPSYPETVPTKYPANAGNPSFIQARVYGQSSFEHILEVQVNGDAVIRDTMVDLHGPGSDDIYIRTFTANYADPLTSNTVFQYFAFGRENGNIDNNLIAWQSITYDRLFNMDGGTMIRVEDWNKTTRGLFEWSNADYTSKGWLVDLGFSTLNNTFISGGNLSVVAPGGSFSRDLVMVTDKGLKTPVIDMTASLSNLSDPGAGADFIIISSRYLQNSAEAYKNYRDTCTVNPLTAKVVYVDEIYDEFGYGSVTPWAIKRFCYWAMQNYVNPPKFFFMWGKGASYTRHAGYNLVPTFGKPASDLDFVSNFDSDTLDVRPLVPIGRVNANTDADGFNYLAKVDEYEHSPWEPWMKEIVILGGGSDVFEQGQIKTYTVSNYPKYVEGTPLGGRAWYYQKYNTDVETNSPAKASDERINDGVSLIQFFGHSSTNIYDVDIREPYLYQNFGKYPLVVAFGCYGGDFTTYDGSFGERFVITADRGSIGYLANSTAGFLRQLGDFGNFFYSSAYQVKFGERLGVVHQDALTRYANTTTAITVQNHVSQLNLQGDPAIHLYTPALPDLAIDESGIFFDPPVVTSGDSSFTMKVITKNLGLAVTDSFYLNVRQQSPSGTWITFPNQKEGPVAYEDTLEIRLPNLLGTEIAGLNMFDIFVDSTDTLTEYSESNNRLFFPQLFQGNLPAVLFPYDFAIVPDDRVKLSACAYVPSGGALNYIFEIDTTYEFTSPLYVSSGISPVVNGTSVYAEWEVPFALQDSQVYYWRVRFPEVLPPVWAQASFKYIASRTGWAQSRPPQFFKDQTDNMSLDKINRTWDFDEWSRSLHAYATVGVFAPPYFKSHFKLDNGVFSSALQDEHHGINYTSFRRTDLSPRFQNTSQGDWVYRYMPDSQGEMISHIQSMDPGDYFLMSSQHDIMFWSWTPAFKTALMQVGVDTAALNKMPPLGHFVLLGKKGNPPGSASLLMEPNLVDTATGVDEISLITQINSRRMDGKIFSTTVGSAIEWQELIWNWKQKDLGVADDIRVNVVAHHADGTDSVVYYNIPRGTYDLSMLDAKRFPTLSLLADAEDSVYLTAPEMKHWHVMYVPAPDATVDPITKFVFVRDTVDEGDTITVSYSVRNLVDASMDSLLVAYGVLRSDRSFIPLDTIRYDSLRALASMELNYGFSTRNRDLEGICRFVIELNPDNDQPEQHLFNNVYSHYFKVVNDRINPILDVTFDGKHIMDGDIVSPSAEIRIQINDENKFLMVSDTAFDVYFGEGTSSAGLPRVFIDGNPEMEKVPPAMPENKAGVIYRPGPMADGDYMLKVQGYDHKGNSAGPVEYEIRFKVVNEVAVSNVLPYPNPFSTSTKFAYTLTGGVLPDRFEILIYTITGKLVKVIDLLEMGQVSTGYNITDYAWDGRDEFGDLLANGVYIYKVVVKTGNNELNLRDEGISQYFKNGIGKLYIMR